MTSSTVCHFYIICLNFLYFPDQLNIDWLFSSSFLFIPFDADLFPIHKEHP